MSNKVKGLIVFLVLLVVAATIAMFFFKGNLDESHIINADLSAQLLSAQKVADEAQGAIDQKDAELKEALEQSAIRENELKQSAQQAAAEAEKALADKDVETRRLVSETKAQAWKENADKLAAVESELAVAKEALVQAARETAQAQAGRDAALEAAKGTVETQEKLDEIIAQAVEETERKSAVSLGAVGSAARLAMDAADQKVLDLQKTVEELTGRVNELEAELQKSAPAENP